MMKPMLSPKTDAFRQRYRTTHIHPWYSGRLHFGFISVLSVTLVVTALLSVTSPTWTELAILPIGFLVCNLAEYLAHRYTMHRPAPGLRLLYRRHSGEHHRFYTHDGMEIETWRDVAALLFPSYLLLFFVLAVALPGGVLLATWVSFNAAALFVALFLGYYITYEWMHFVYHLGDDSPIGGSGLIQWLKRHHIDHHNLRLMHAYNFNITFPIFDVLFGTRYVRQDHGAPHPVSDPHFSVDYSRR